jgi:hypothetical protein
MKSAIQQMYRHEAYPKLEAQLHLAYDPNHAEELLTRVWNQPLEFRDEKLLGEGTFFQGVLLKKPTEQGCGLVLSVPKESFCEGRLPSKMKKWWKAMECLRDGDTTLIPPMILMRVGEAHGVVLPYGDEKISSCDPKWHPLLDMQLAMHNELKDAGLILEDVFQGRSVGGVPFAIDFSDLSFNRDR